MQVIDFTNGLRSRAYCEAVLNMLHVPIDPANERPWTFGKEMSLLRLRNEIPVAALIADVLRLDCPPDGQ